MPWIAFGRAGRWSVDVNTEGYSRVESAAVRSALVADLAHSTVPTSIMGATLVGIALYAHAITGMVPFLLAAAGGGAASAAKVVLMRLQRRHAERGAPGQAGSDSARTGRWEKAHAAATAVVASCVGGTAGAIFLRPDPSLQMLATALIFGYCSGVVVRVGIRPWIAVPALLLAAVPPIAAAALWNDVPHHVMVAVFTVFLLGSFESVRHVHRTAVRLVGMRLEMASLAQNDPLTGLANRIGLREAFRAIGPDDPVAIVCLDLDGFKPINDRYGHAAGDAVLRTVAERLLAVVSADATVVRMGGDEFVVLQPGLDGRDAVAALARRIDGSLREPFAINGEEVRIGASVGHAVSPFKPIDLDALLVRADEASYRAKSGWRETPRHPDESEPEPGVSASRRRDVPGFHGA